MVQGHDEMVERDAAFVEEERKLAEVVEYIEGRRLRMRKQMPATAADTRTANAIQEILDEDYENLYEALDQPYFGRVDFRNMEDEESGSENGEVGQGGNGVRTESSAPGDAESGNGEARRVYITGIQIPATTTLDTGIVNWTNPVAGLWYTTSYEDGYTAPRGHIPARVDLKRHLRIRDGRLEGLNEIFRRMLPAAGDARQALLLEALGGMGDGGSHLQVIVETIEPDQYDRIANVSDKVLVVQGAAGSGKSEIGLHRIAYLLSPHNDIPAGERPTPETTLFVGPSQAFLEYAADILPGLGVREGVQQVRFSEWVMEGLSERVRIQPRVWNNLLNDSEVTRFNESAESFKGSLLMADAIESHVRGLFQEVRKSVKRLSELSDPYTGATILKSEIGEAVNAVLPRAGGIAVGVNSRRLDFINQVTGRLFSEGQYGRRLRSTEARQRREDLMKGVVTPWCDAVWRHLDFRQEYVRLLSDGENMERASGGVLDSEYVSALGESVARARENGFGDADVGALAYLDHLLNGTIQSRYRHIVVDEAQDISPIEFKLLSVASSNNWFTVLGDTAQRLTPYRGVRTWRELERVFGRFDLEVQRARRSYRANLHITRFNNRILRTFDANIPPPIPFERDGHRVEYHRHRTARDMYERVVEEIERVRSMEGLDDAVVAILARDSLNLNRFEAFCEERGIDWIERIGQEKHSDSRTVLARIPDVKGLEYDAVIVMGVNETFSDTLFNKKLLYMATTRAKHYLGIHWFDRQSAILRSISSRGVVVK